MSGSLFLSLILILLNHFGLTFIRQHATQLLATLNFQQLLLNGMLSFLLFAGALNIDMTHLRKQFMEVAILASLGTIASAFLIGLLAYWLLRLLHFPLDYIYCLLFGALISPTDPIAVLATFRRLKAPAKLEVIVEGESLFNDGVGIVIFLTVFHLAFSGTPVTINSVLILFLQQAIGGICYGFILGAFSLWLIRAIDEPKLIILITLVLTTGGYALAQQFNISGPLAMVVAGIIIGNAERRHAISKANRAALDSFWVIIDEVLNAVLFLLIGFELLAIKASYDELIVALLSIPMVLFVRFITVAAPMHLFKRFRDYPPFTTTILIWGGLRGGLAVALALTLPAGQHKSMLLAMTYAVVAFAIIVQGTTVKTLVRKAKSRP